MLVSLGVFAGLIASVGTRRHQRSLMTCALPKPRSVRRSRRSVRLSSLGRSSRRLCPFCLRVRCCNGSDRLESCVDGRRHRARSCQGCEHQRRQCTPCQSDCSLGLGPDRSECRECKASQALPTKGEQVAEQQKDAANLLTKHRTTPVSPRKSPCGKRSKQADKETAAVTVGSESGSGDQHRRKRAQQLVELQLSCRTQTWRAGQLRRRLETSPQHIKRAEECQFESYPRVADSNSADYDVTRMCKEGAKCSERKTRPWYARRTTCCSTDAAV